MATPRGIEDARNASRHYGVQGEDPGRLDESWIRRPRFEPVEDSCFELAFGRIPSREDEDWEIRRVRVEGTSIEDWIDLDSGRPLERRLYAYAIKAWRPLPAQGGGAGLLH